MILTLQIHLSPEADLGALRQALDTLSKLQTPEVHGVLRETTPAVSVESTGVSAPGAAPAVAQTMAPTRGRGRPRNPPAAATVAGVPQEPAQAVTPPPQAPNANTARVVQHPSTPQGAPKTAAAEVSASDIDAMLGGDDAKPLTLDDLTLAVRTFVSAHSADAMREVFSASGYQKLSAVPPDQIGVMIDKLQSYKPPKK